MGEGVLGHGNIPGVHHRYAGAVLAKRIVLVGIVVRKHEMQAIPEVALAVVAQDAGVGHTFEINPVAMPGYPVVGYGNAVAVPGVDAISRGLFHRTAGLEPVAADPAIFAARQVNGKKQKTNGKKETLHEMFL